MTNELFAAQRLDGKVVVVTGSTQGLAAADASRPFGRLLRPQMNTGSVIDFDQTVHGPYGAHVPAAAVIGA